MVFTQGIRTYLLAAIFVLFPLLAFHGPAQADHVVPRGVALNLSTITEFKPFIWQENGEAKGIDADIVMELCRRTGIRCLIDFYPWKRVLSQIETGFSHGGFTGFRTPEREKFAVFLDHPLHFSTYSIYVKSGQEFNYAGISDLYGKTVGVVRGFVISPEFTEAVEQGRIRIQEADSVDQNIRKLLAGGRLDAVIANHHKMQIKVAEMQAACDLSCLPTPVVPPRPAYLMISRKWDDPGKAHLIMHMNAALKSMYDDGTIDRINANYLD